MKSKVFFAVFCSLCLAVAGMRLAFCRLDIWVEGEYTAFDRRDAPISAPVRNGYERVDTTGGEKKARDVLSVFWARTVKEEQIDGIHIYYAYAPVIGKFETVFGKRVNLMIAVRGEQVAVGSPLLLGSY